VDDALIEMHGVSKEYGGLRPLRLSAFTVRTGDRVAILGMDAAAAEIAVNLLTGATLPDQGEIRLFGRATSAIADADDWLATLDRLGMVSPRAMLAEEFTVAQGIAMAFTLSLDPVPGPIAAEVARLARDAGLGPADLARRLADATPLVKARCRLARALATSPAVLILEHANALVPVGAAAFGREIAALAKARRMAVVALTVDEAFATAVASRTLALDASTGRLQARSVWRRVFR
jgi:ABC-type transporter Mla maintaining outer membrane lipid asymmetry ATPase subunit MlaF